MVFVLQSHDSWKCGYPSIRAGRATVWSTAPCFCQVAYCCVLPDCVVRWSMFTPLLEVCGPQGASRIQIQGPCCPFRCFSNQQFQVILFIYDVLQKHSYLLNFFTFCRIIWKSLAASSRFSSRMALYLARFIFPLALTNFTSLYWRKPSW